MKEKLSFDELKEKLSVHRSICPECNSEMRLVKGASWFFGCRMYPKTGCQGRRQPTKEILQEIMKLEPGWKRWNEEKKKWEDVKDGDDFKLL